MHIKVAALAVLFGLGATEAMAQPGWYREYPNYRPSYREVPPGQVVRIVRRQGLTPVSRPALRGPNYVVQALDRNGELTRVVLDAETGEIVRVRPLARGLPPADIARPARPPMPRDFDDDEVASVRPEAPTQWHGPRPRAGVPSAGQPRRTAAVVPTTPLPRPRPAEAPQADPAVAKPDVAPAPAPQPAAVTPDAPKPEAATTEVSKPQATEPGNAAAPRVVLPGGPPAKHEQAAGAAEARAPESKPAEASAPPIPANPPAASPSSTGIPPAQSLE